MKNPKSVKQQIGNACERFGVEILYAFGSRAKEVRDFVKGKTSSLDAACSDVDIGFKLRPGTKLPIREKTRLGMELEDILDVSRVDLCDMQEGDPFVAANIVRGERLFSRDEYVADNYDLYVLRRAGDLAYLERKRIALILGSETQE